MAFGLLQPIIQIIFIIKTMQLAKRRASLEPIRPQLFQTTRNAIISLPRAVCSKPVTKGRQTPSSALAALLPPLKQNALLRKRPPSQLPSPPPRNRFKLTLEYHVLPQRSLGKRSSSSRQSGLDTITLSQRKESHLNTCYNQENSDNHRIYQRIKSQKSLYCSRELDQSFECTRSLSRRLSSSKLSKMASMRSSDSLRQSIKRKEETGLEGKLRSIKLEPQDINKLQVDKMYRYLSIFCNNLNIKEQADKQKLTLPPKTTHNNKENNQTLHRPRLSKIREENNQRGTRRSNLKAARRH